jgi:DNA-binding transcriptional MerR regulator
MNDRMRIGDLTERAGVTPRTVRYYESIGLLPPGEREGHGQHYYTAQQVESPTPIASLLHDLLRSDAARA